MAVSEQAIRAAAPHGQNRHYYSTTNHIPRDSGVLTCEATICFHIKQYHKLSQHDYRASTVRPSLTSCATQSVYGVIALDRVVCTHHTFKLGERTFVVSSVFETSTLTQANELTNTPYTNQPSVKNHSICIQTDRQTDRQTDIQTSSKQTSTTLVSNGPRQRRQMGGAGARGE